jgi:hypothetical protein
LLTKQVEKVASYSASIVFGPSQPVALLGCTTRTHFLGIFQGFGIAYIVRHMQLFDFSTMSLQQIVENSTMSLLRIVENSTMSLQRIVENSTMSL